MSNRIQVIWRQGPVAGAIAVAHGRLAAVRVVRGPGRTKGASFAASSTGEVRLLIECAGVRVGAGANATRVTVNTKRQPFSFFLRDVRREFPIFIPEYGVIVTTTAETRRYPAIVDWLSGKGLVAQPAAIEQAPEENYEAAGRRNRNLVCPTWLGVGRDLRIFRVSYLADCGYWGYAEPCDHSVPVGIPETENRPYRIAFGIGPGASCRVQISRRLEDGCLPILHSEQREDDVTYQLTAFATLETQPLHRRAVRGSDWQAAYSQTGGNMLTPPEVAAIRGLIAAETRGREEEVVCCLRVKAVNNGRVPRYAWFKGLRLTPAKSAGFLGSRGFSTVGPDRVAGINRLNGQPLPQEELAILLPPGEAAVLDLLIPHQPISVARARRLAKLDIQQHLDACRKFWRGKLAAGAQIQVPEPAIDERIRAGLLHCDLVTLGKQSGGPLLATIGWYGPIGSESAPIIQFFDSMGWHQLAERALDFFLARQRPDGFMQNFAGYQLETGPALWSMGEHYRYTRDDAWVKRIKPGLLRACAYLLAWRERNKRPELRGTGYGLLEGKVADPEDFFHSFMLNGLSYLGIRRVAEMLAKIAPAESKRLHRESDAFRRDIRQAFYEALARSPAIPLGDGTWVPSVPPWAEYPGPVSLYAEGGTWHTHGAFGARDSLIGSLYLVISEVLDPDEIGTTFLLKTHQQLFTVENAGLAQPYYCRHDHIHLTRGEVKPFLKTYYNQLTSLQDRETYTFWEHYFFASQHKTHEEAWFLMQTRWMLWREEGDTLRLLGAIPRAWLRDGQSIRLDNVASYFGPVSLRVESHLARHKITARVVCNSRRKPRQVALRLPHPAGRQAISVDGGNYDAARETVWIKPFNGRATVTLHFPAAGKEAATGRSKSPA